MIHLASDNMAFKPKTVVDRLAFIRDRAVVARANYARRKKQKSNASVMTPVTFADHTLKGTSTGGKQEKAPGTGIYVYQEDGQEKKCFIKRANNPKFQGDDIAEVMSSQLAGFLFQRGIKNGTFVDGEQHRFATCEFVVGSNGLPYVKSLWSEGFEELHVHKGPISDFPMDAVLPRRLQKRRAIFRSLDLSPTSQLSSEKQQLSHILAMGALLGDNDTGTQNIGRTKNNGIVKIDHGWAFADLARWKNPKRVKLFKQRKMIKKTGGHIRAAPTNHLNDYPDLQLTPEFAQGLRDIGNVMLLSCVEGSLSDYMRRQLGGVVQAHESLGPKEQKKALDALCKHIGLPRYRYETSEAQIQRMSDKLAEIFEARSRSMIFNAQLLDTARIIKQAQVLSPESRAEKAGDQLKKIQALITEHFGGKFAYEYMPADGPEFGYKDGYDVLESCLKEIKSALEQGIRPDSLTNELMDFYQNMLIVSNRSDLKQTYLNPIETMHKQQNTFHSKSDANASSRSDWVRAHRPAPPPPVSSHTTAPLQPTRSAPPVPTRPSRNQPSDTVSWPPLKATRRAPVPPFVTVQGVDDQPMRKGPASPSVNERDIDKPPNRPPPKRPVAARQYAHQHEKRPLPQPPESKTSTTNKAPPVPKRPHRK